jgi:hypothetical protein
MVDGGKAEVRGQRLEVRKRRNGRKYRVERFEGRGWGEIVAGAVGMADAEWKWGDAFRPFRALTFKTRYLGRRARKDVHLPAGYRIAHRWCSVEWFPGGA